MPSKAREVTIQQLLLHWLRGMCIYFVRPSNKVVGSLFTSSSATLRGQQFVFPLIYHTLCLSIPSLTSRSRQSRPQFLWAPEVRATVWVPIHLLRHSIPIAITCTSRVRGRMVHVPYLSAIRASEECIMTSSVIAICAAENGTLFAPGGGEGWVAGAVPLFGRFLLVGLLKKGGGKGRNAGTYSEISQCVGAGPTETGAECEIGLATSVECSWALVYSHVFGFPWCCGDGEEFRCAHCGWRCERGNAERLWRAVQEAGTVVMHQTILLPWNEVILHSLNDVISPAVETQNTGVNAPTCAHLSHICEGVPGSSTTYPLISKQDSVVRLGGTYPQEHEYSAHPNSHFVRQ